MKSIKQLLSIAALVAVSALPAKADLVYSTNLLSAITRAPAFTLIPGRVNIKQIQITGTTPALVKFYDNNNLANPFFGTNYTFGTYTNRLSYSTNYVTTFVGNNGLTNYLTNQGIWTYDNTVAAGTNVLTPDIVLPVVANVLQTFTTDTLFNSGVTVTSDTNATIIIYYNLGQ